MFVIDAVTGSPNSRHKSEIYCTMEINDKNVELELTPARNAVPSCHPSRCTLNCKFNCHLKSACRNLEFHIVERHVTPVLGLTDVLNLDLSQLHSEVHEVDTVDVFLTTMLNEYGGDLISTCL